MHRTLIAAVGAMAVVAAVLMPVAQASPGPGSPSATLTTTPEMSGADCEWGTEAVGAAPPAATRAYLRGDDWRRDHEPPVECAVGPAWTPLVQHFPYSKIIAQSDFGGRATVNVLCGSLDDPRCSPRDWVQVLSQSVTDVCERESDFNCVETLEVIDPRGEVQSARYLRGFPQTQEIPESNAPDAFMPAGGSVPLWEYHTDAGTARILSIGTTDLTYRSSGGRWVSMPDGQFSFALVPVAMQSRPGVPAPRMVEQIDPSTGLTGVNREGWGHPLTQGCAAFDQDECAVDAPFPSGYRYRVALRMRDTSSLYLNGAMDLPVAYSTKVSGGHRFVLEAGPSPVIGIAGWIPKSQIPRGVIEGALREAGNRSWEVDFDAASYRSLGRGGVDALAWLKALLPFFGDRASFIADAWYVENTASLGQYVSRCVDRGKGEFLGIVASNATAYTGDPPRYNARASTLSYEIAGPHYMPDGTTLSKGRYAINMNADFVRCILGVDKIPSQARVELIYPDGEASAATLAVKQDRNWLRLTYENFTFSSPTVSVKFPKSLTCTKGKGKKAKTKKVVAFQCPKGWKPQR